MRLITSAHYAEEMQNTVEPTLASIHASGVLPIKGAVDGSGLYYDHYSTPNAKAVIVVSHGYSESAEKFKEMIYYMVEEGYEVYAVDHRGHGRSFRQSRYPSLAHINSFYDYVEDLHSFVSLVVKTGSNLPLYLYGHSMGGGIAATYIEKYPSDFKKAVLSSPMVKLKLPAPEFVLRLYGGAKCLFGQADTFGPGQHPYEGLEDFSTSCSSNEARFRYYQTKKATRKELQVSAFSYGWIYHSMTAISRTRSKRECGKITIPVLILRSGNDSLIDPGGLAQFARYTKGAKIKDFQNSKHEIYNSDDDVIAAYAKEIFEFLAN